jgi:hypothetical protein
VTSGRRFSIGEVRRATVADAAAIALLSTEVPSPSQASANRAAFVIEGDEGLLGVVDLEQAADHLAVMNLAVVSGTSSPGLAHTLLAFAEVTARAIGLREVRLRPGALPAGVAPPRRYRDGVRRLSGGRLARSLDHLESLGVPLLRDGSAALDQTLYFRGVWAAMAVLIGFGSISVAVFTGGDVTLLHVLGPALICAAGVLFAFWQIVLIVAAARRVGSAVTRFATFAAAALAIIGIVALIRDRAVPAVAELWAIHSGDTALNDLSVAVSADGATLYVDGSYGVGSEEAVRRALMQHRSIRRVVLSGPGGRVSAAYEINRLIHARRLATHVDTGCASACTIAFLGGIERSISPTGRLGFHQGSFPGMSANDMFESNRDMRRFLIASGVTPAFAQRVIDTPHDEIWTPTPEELLAGRVINRVNR